VKYITVIAVLSSVAYAHTEDIFPDYSAIIKRMEYAERLEQNLKSNYKQVTVSLFGLELEHILILSPHCQLIKNNILTDAYQLGILSATCRWYDAQSRVRISK